MPNKLLPLAALLGCAILAGCDSTTDVSATGNAPAQYTHVFLTINAIWFNTSASAGPADSSWVKFTLAAPATIDLVTLNNGTLSQFASSLKLSAGTYAQVRVVLADSTDTLATAAQSAGAATNDEVDYYDTSDVSHTAPLAVLNAAEGIGISTSLTVAASSSVGTTSTATSSAATSSSSTTTTTSTDTVSTTAAIVDFDATTDLVPVSLSGQPAFLLNPHPHNYNVSSSGTIQGTVSLTNVSTLSNAGNADVEVSAESLSSDGTRHVVVKTTRVGSDGTFVLYPLSTASGAPGSYDLVIHGPEIQTVIVKAVPVTNSAPGGTTAQLAALTLTTATPYLVNLNPTSPASPASSLVGFYQTLPLSAEEPYLVEERAVDPVTGLFASDQEVSGGPVQYGTYGSSTITLTTATPSEGAGTYEIGAINPAYGTAALGTTTVTAPASTTTTATTALFTMTAPPVPSGTTANTVSGTVSITSSAYDTAELFLTYDGALVNSAPLSAYLRTAQSTLSLTGIAPGGSADSAYGPGVYYAEVWEWNSTNPTGTLVRIPYSGTIDLSAGTATGVSLSLN